MKDTPRSAPPARAGTPAPAPDDTVARLLSTSRHSFAAEREAEDDFIARGLRAAQQARRSGRYVSARAVLHQLAQQLNAVCGHPPP